MQKPKDRYIKVGNINTHYWDEGEGDSTIVLVHGINASVSFWEKNIFELAKKYRVVALDLIGFGDTDKPVLKYDIDILMGFLKSFLDELHIKKCFLIGHSLGGGVCLKFAVEFSSYIEKLILVSPVGFYQKVPLAMRLVTLPFIGNILVKASKKLIAKAIRFYVYDDNVIGDEFIENTKRINDLPGAKNTLVSLIQSHVNLKGIRNDVVFSIAVQLSPMKIPTLIIWGKQDKLLPVKGAYKAIEFMPHAKLSIFDECGHIPQIEHPDKFDKVVDEFITADNC